jgi:putative ABC transport system permease protein
MQTEGNLRAGMSVEEARRQARLASGGLLQATESFRDAQRVPFIETTWRDLRYALRMIRRAPGFSVIVIAMLAIGIGANTAIYSVTRAVLTPPAIPNPDRVVFVWTDAPSRGWRQLPASVPDFGDWAASGLFSHLGALSEAGFNVRIVNQTERVKGLQLTGSAFDAFHVPAALGRTFTSLDTTPGHEDVAIIGDLFWRTRLQGDPSIVGKDLVVDGAVHRIVGVMPPSFPRFAHEEIYIPLVFQEPTASDRGKRNLIVIGRLADRVGLAAAQQRMSEISSALGARFPDADGGIVARLQPIGDALVEDAHVMLTVLFGAVGLMLLMACANIATLLLARGTARAREMALRAALGAGRWRLCRQLLVEHALLGMIGGIVALAPAIVALRFIGSFELEELPNANHAVLRVGALSFDVALSLATSIVFGLVPLWQTWHTDVRYGLKSALGSMSIAMHHRLRGAFVVVECALAIVLLVAAGLLLRSFQEIRATDPGYDPDDVLAMRIALSDRRYETPASQLAFYDRLRDRVKALPGVAGVSAASELPTTDNYHATGLRTSEAAPAKPDDLPIVLYESVMADYFHVMHVSILEGRAFTESDGERAPLVAMVDRSTAARTWPGERAIGKRLRLGAKEPWREVVGIVADVEQGVLVKLLKGRLGQVYLPFAQAPKAATSIVVRTHGDPTAVVPAIREIARTIDVDQPIFQIQTLVEARAAGRAAHRLATTLLATFAAVALTLAVLGIYGVVTNIAGERTREFGIRMSLGAQPGDVLQIVFRHAVWLMSLGALFGVAAAFALTRLVASFLVGVRATDPATFAGVVLLLGGLGLVASYVPARRATRVDPTTALRCE